MDLINYILVIIVVINSALGLLIHLRAPKNRISIFYQFVVITVILWTVGMILYRAASPEISLLWCRILYTPPTWIASAFLYFTYIFRFRERQFTLFEKLLMIIPNILIIVFVWNPQIIIQDVTVPLKGEKIIHWGSFYFLYALYIFGYFSLGLWNLFRRFLCSRGINRLQAKYVFSGYFLSANLAMFTNLFMPWWGNFSLNWIGQMLTVFYIGCTTYAIVKYRLMDIRLIISRSILYAMLVMIVTAMVAFLTLFSATLFQDVFGMSSILTMMGFSLIIVLTLEPLKRYLAKTTDYVFYRGRVDYQEILRLLNIVLGREIELSSLVPNALDILKKELKLKQTVLLLDLENKTSFVLFPKTEREIQVLRNHPMVNTFKKTALPVIREELERELVDLPEGRERQKKEEMRQDFESWGVAVTQPIVVEGKLKGILCLGDKLSGDVFSNEDLRLLDLFSPQLGTALEKARLYQEVKDFSVTLKEEVKKATADLRITLDEVSERNQNLATLQKFSDIILRTFETQTMVQNIIDSIPEGMAGCDMAVLILVDKAKQRVFAKTISQKTSIAQRVYQMIGKNLEKYSVPIQGTHNLTTKTILEHKATMSRKLSDFVSPPLPASVAAALEKIGDPMSWTIAAPLVVGKNTLGALLFVFTIKKKSISDADLNVIKSIADEVALALERADFYERIKEANIKLKTANDSLKELDQAKSDFMAIASHQLRTPLSGIMGYLSMMTEGDYGKMSSQQSEVVEKILEASWRLIRMVDVFLDVTRIEAGTFQLHRTSVRMEDLIASCIQELTIPAEKKGLKLAFHSPKTPLPQFEVDQDKMKDVVLNLIDNAIKYTERGRIDVTAKKNSPLTILVSIRDTGVGIDPAEAKKLFNKFVRGSGMARIFPGGAGLGLFIAKKIVEAHGGKIWAESAGEGKGSTFRFEVPIK